MNKQPLHLLLAPLICIISGSLFMIISYFIQNENISHFDLSIIEFIQGFEAPWLTTFFKAFTWIGSAYGVIPITIVVCIILFFRMRYYGQALLFAFSMVGTILFNEILKQFFKRQRPEIYRIMDIGGFSFPSGHAMMAFSLYGMIVYVCWRHVRTTSSRLILVSFAAFMAFSIAISRIYVGVHFPSDIIGGIAASTFFLTIVISIYERNLQK